tara:strand:- start:1233 stop:2411 length:1179 start_codon:yes stop_codon:yes gene_type:complete
MFKKSLFKVEKYIRANEYRGYDPYDTLKSFIPFNIFGRFGAMIAIQLQKRNPINIRPLLGVRKGINPKAMGLFLKSYINLYKITGEEKYHKDSKFIFDWLKKNYSKGYKGYCWGYNFDWANKDEYLKSYEPNVVVTGTIIDAIFSYYKVFRDEDASEIIQSASNFVAKDLPIIDIGSYKSIGYNTHSKNCCYNASLYGALILSLSDQLSGKNNYVSLMNQILELIVSKQKDNGSWYYSYNIKNKTERKQIDFHQGYILVLLNDIMKNSSINKNQIENSIQLGVEFYKNEQFFDNGRSKWRLPRDMPTDIHNQAQGIITFSKLSFLDDRYYLFAKTIADWTIYNMQDDKGFFYYQNCNLYKNKIPYIRWSQAWMFLALTELILCIKKMNNESN